MDLVYILGKGSTWGNNEIRYSLRSVEKNLSGFSRVFVVGERPDFLNNVIHIPCPNHKQRQLSIFNKIMKAVNDPRVSEDFLHFADDYYIISPTHVNEIGYYNNGLLEERVLKYAGLYRTAMANTIEAGALYNYDIHTPFKFNKDRFRMNVASLDWSKEYIIKSAYMRDEGGEYLEDCKINKSIEYRQLLKMNEGKRFLSSGLLAPAMMEFLKRTFPNKSKFEL